MLHCSCDIVHSPHFLLTELSVWRAFHQSGTNSATNICSRQGPHSSNTIKRLLRAKPPPGNPSNRGTPLSVSPAFRFEDVNRCRAERRSWAVGRVWARPDKIQTVPRLAGSLLCAAPRKRHFPEPVQKRWWIGPSTCSGAVERESKDDERGLSAGPYTDIDRGRDENNGLRIPSSTAQVDRSELITCTLIHFSPLNGRHTVREGIPTGSLVRWEVGSIHSAQTDSVYGTPITCRAQTESYRILVRNPLQKLSAITCITYHSHVCISLSIS